jgi:acetoin utilization deacetylase AcuC-like enzyme
MKDTGFVLDERYRLHDTGPGHPERSDRIAVLLRAIEEGPGLRRIAPRAATGDEITLVHDQRHFEAVGRTSGQTRAAFDADTPVSADSFDTACLAAGGMLAAVDAVMAGEIDNAFAMVRPPGHHAERSQAMGFCLFNNVAVGAEYLRRRHGLQRILVMDWDVHHGNGTQHSFYGDPGVLFISTHRYPFYPGTGAIDEVGRGDGEGFTVNLPLPAGFGDVEYDELFDAVVVPIAEAFNPEFVLISAGFDPHARDPLGGMAVTEAGFARMAHRLLDVAERCAQRRCVAVLEGGYDLQAIRDSSVAVLDQFRGRPAGLPRLANGPPSRANPVVAAARRRFADFWGKW